MPANFRQPADFAPRHDMKPKTKSKDAKYVRKLRLMVGKGNWKQRHISDYLGCSLSLYSAIEQGKRNPKPALIMRLEKMVQDSSLNSVILL